ncbi:hypothetical protein L2E82_21633 [Cichorium intybus]|uniref:Uncharacterized protein n=1 Tax=Cichorium intybus TaxID=13427 RepID=A0ACB9DWG9_CICIN|nr:hypothetical protein L2E82_21633 [Cichorium intybus]
MGSETTLRSLSYGHASPCMSMGQNPKCYESSKTTNQGITLHDRMKWKVRRVDLLTLLLKNGVMHTIRYKPFLAPYLILPISQNLQRLETEEPLPKPVVYTPENLQKHEP